MSIVKDTIVRWVNENVPADRNITRREMAELIRYICGPYSPCAYGLEEMVGDIDHHTGDERPMVLVEAGDERLPTFWLLGWRCGDATPIHDHHDSEVAVGVVRGSIKEDIYPSTTSSAKVTREFLESSVVTMPAPYVHVVRNDCDYAGVAVTLHAYYPKLDEMGFYEETGGELVLTGKWSE